jgi:Tyrosine phosphatase family
MSAHEDLLRGKAVTLKHSLDLHHVARALEDIPEDAREQLNEISSVPQATPLWRRIADELENAGLDAFGNLERVPLLHFLSHYPVKSYTYGISSSMSRGERPNPEKLRQLFDDGHCKATVNLCEEMPDGDSPIISLAGLAGQLETTRIPIVDMMTPSFEQVTDFLGKLAEREPGMTYVHCEAGKGRTGVMTACHRMAVMGWEPAEALAEAENFGCSVPMQQEFIQKIGLMLQAQHQARVTGSPLPHPVLGEYPLLAPGSVKATPQQLAATLDSVARAEPA